MCTWRKDFGYSIVQMDKTFWNEETEQDDPYDQWRHEYEESEDEAGKDGGLQDTEKFFAHMNELHCTSLYDLVNRATLRGVQSRLPQYKLNVHTRWDNSVV